MDKKSLIFFLIAFFICKILKIKQKIHNVCVNLNEMC